jgi:succinate-acetate transporter protein
MSYATILIPSSGILAAYVNPQELENAIGIYLITWFMVTVMLMFVPFHLK